MNPKKSCTLNENMKIRNKLLSLGLGYTTIGPTGPKGEKGDQGPKGEQGPQGDPAETPISSTEEILFASFIDTNNSQKMNIQDKWLVPSTSKYFKIINDQEIEIQPGIYEINLSGQISQADDTHGAEFYLINNDGSAIKDLSFELKQGQGKQIHYSQSILFRFEKQDTLRVETNLLGDTNPSNLIISNVTLLIKKLKE